MDVTEVAVNIRVFGSTGVCLLTFLAAAAPAWAQSAAPGDLAQIGAPEDLAQPDSKKDTDKPPIDILVGVKGGAEMTATSEVPKLTLQQQLKYGQPVDDTGFYPGFGVGPGVGLTLEVRLWKVLGLESGLYYMADDVTGWNDKKVNNVERGRVIMEQTTSALHVPLLLKGVINTQGIQPFLGIGLEFVFQQGNSLAYRTERKNPNDWTIDQFGTIFEARNRISTSDYTLFQLTTGVEIDLDYVRIPIEIRAGYHLGWDDGFDQRISATQDGPNGSYVFTSNGASLAHFGFFTGVVYDFDLAQ